MDKKLLSYRLLLVLIAVFGIGAFVFAQTNIGSVGVYNEAPSQEQSPEEDLGAAILTGEPLNVAGSRTGTSTPVGVLFANSTATTTYPIMLDPLAENGIFTIFPTSASTTPDGTLKFSLLASNDSQCDTATTTTTMNDTVIVSDILWFDAGDLIRGATQDNPFETGTTTISWTGVKRGTNKQFIVEGLNSRCLALQVNGSSTEAWIQFKQKSKP